MNKVYVLQLLILLIFLPTVFGQKLEIKMENGKVLDFSSKKLMKYYIASGAEGVVFNHPNKPDSIIKIFMSNEKYVKELQDTNYLRSNSNIPVPKIIYHKHSEKNLKAWMEKPKMEITLMDECKTGKITNPSSVNKILNQIVDFSDSDEKIVILDWKPSNIMRTKFGKWYLIDFNLERMNNFDCKDAFDTYFFGACKALVKNPCILDTKL